ncbi:aldose 1-epimerase family protein [uncultured Algibacter sp.]|uniref:aldose 1-epimerase family protein n=1 Tax=uncultured Algibacter sp. TaxID=298659 RepID=UPI0026162876|nr:aldose 1-epimerase family protein [uncultured Algibacter sp.]
MKNSLKLMFRSFWLSCLLLGCISNQKQKNEIAFDTSILKVNEKDDIYKLINNECSATFKIKGAEMISLKANNIEYIWFGDPEVWSGQAPILFPIVGRLKDHEYLFKGQTYTMKQHGFARDNNFKVVAKTDNSITFEQIATKESKAIYPFDFVLQVKYTLKGKTLLTKYIVKNPSVSEELYFSIGAHPSFNCPFEANQKRNEYQLVFDKKIAPKFQTNINGIYEGHTKDVFKDKGILDLPDTIFDDKSLALSPNVFSKVTFVHKPTKKPYLSVNFKGFPFLGIWSISNTSPFICIEPWYGIADRKYQNKDFTKKEGVQKLNPQSTFETSFSISIL